MDLFSRQKFTTSTIVSIVHSSISPGLVHSHTRTGCRVSRTRTTDFAWLPPTPLPPCSSSIAVSHVRPGPVRCGTALIPPMESRASMSAVPKLTDHCRAMSCKTVMCTSECVTCVHISIQLLSKPQKYPVSGVSGYGTSPAGIRAAHQTWTWKHDFERIIL